MMGVAKPKTGAQRVADSKARGRQIAVVIRDERALENLARLEREHGGPTAAVTTALLASDNPQSVR